MQCRSIQSVVMKPSEVRGSKSMASWGGSAATVDHLQREAVSGGGRLGLAAATRRVRLRLLRLDSADRPTIASKTRASQTNFLLQPQHRRAISRRRPRRLTQSRHTSPLRNHIDAPRLSSPRSSLRKSPSMRPNPLLNRREDLVRLPRQRKVRNRTRIPIRGQSLERQTLPIRRPRRRRRSRTGLSTRTTRRHADHSLKPASHWQSERPQHRTMGSVMNGADSSAPRIFGPFAHLSHLASGHLYHPLAHPPGGPARGVSRVSLRAVSCVCVSRFRVFAVARRPLR